MGATNIVWYLDGPLRYIPLDALIDPQSGRYLIEKYSFVNYSPLGHSLADAPKFAGATGIAMGTSRSYDSKLGALPNVVIELETEVTDPKVKESHGLIPGTILLDGDFTESAMEQKLRSQTVVHIATHFILEPGNDSMSYLLLGGKDQDARGYHLSLTDFRQNKDLHFEGAELVTLSACETKLRKTNAMMA